jgi:hypothetical protein
MARALRLFIFYQDETWVNQNHSPSKTFQDFNDRGGIKMLIGKG